MSLYPHEIKHFKYDHYFDAREFEFIPWDHCACCELEICEAEDARLASFSKRSFPIPIPGVTLKPMFERVHSVSKENYFYGSPFLPRISETRFLIAMEKQLPAMQQGSGHIYIEAYRDRSVSCMLQG